MELWIRSQDKGLLERAVALKVGQLNDNINGIITNFRYCIIVNNDYVFAEYKTEKRALEVLDEIEKLLLKTTNVSFTGKEINVNNPQEIVYTMPDK